MASRPRCSSARCSPARRSTRPATRSRFGGLRAPTPAGTTTFVAGAHNLLDGDSVYYFAPAGGTAVGGLVSGQRYIVNVVDAYTLKLLLPGTVEKAVSLPASQVCYDSATNVGTINAANTFAEGDAVTYHAPPVRSFGSGAVELAVGGNGQPQRNADNTPIYTNDDTIFLGSNPDANGNFQTGHGYATGDQITYTASGGNTRLRDRVRGAADALRHPHRPVPHPARRQPLPRDGL